MIVAIYYFLHGAKLALKIFTFFAYTVGMMVLLGEMLVEANIKAGVIEALRALPAEHVSRPIVRYLAVYDSWLALTRGSRSIFLSGCFGSLCVTCFFSGNETRSSSIPNNIPTGVKLSGWARFGVDGAAGFKNRRARHIPSHR